MHVYMLTGENPTGNTYIYDHLLLYMSVSLYKLSLLLVTVTCDYSWAGHLYYKLSPSADGPGRRGGGVPHGAGAPPQAPVQ